MIFLTWWWLIFLKLELSAEGNFLWEVNDGGTKLYLLGSIHLMRKEMYPLDEKIEASFQNSDILVVEADPSKIDQQKMTELVMQNGFYKEGESLETKITAELYQKVSETFNNFDTPITQIRKYKPWLICLKLGLMNLEKLGMKSELGVDVHFIAKAQEREMEILELESADLQITLLSSFPEEHQIDYLEHVLNDTEDIERAVNDMIAAWKTGNVDSMNATVKQRILEDADKLPGLRDYYNNLFSQRDEHIFQKLITYLKSDSGKTYFVIVGAGHLVGKDGLLQMLEDNGYKTVQL